MGPKYDERDFVRVWMRAYREGGGIQRVAAEMGMRRNYVWTFAQRLRDRGVRLPAMQYGTKSAPAEVLNAIVSDGGAA